MVTTVRSIYFVMVCFLAVGCSKAKQSSSSLPTAAYIDISRIGGEWHIPARIPTILDRNAVAMRVKIVPDSHGFMKMDWSFKANPETETDTTWKLTSSLENPSSSTSWVVSPFWPLQFRYQVIEYSGDYSWLVVGSADRRYVWILSREKDMPSELLSGLLGRLESSDFDIAAIRSEIRKTIN